jgi:hypothetical protein
VIQLGPLVSLHRVLDRQRVQPELGTDVGELGLARRA